MTRRRFCPKGHDTVVWGRATNGQCRLCRQHQQTTPAYKARRRERQSTPQALSRRHRYDLLIASPKAWALRIARSISALDAKLGGLFTR